MEVTLAFWKDQSVLTTILQIVAAVLLLVAFIFCCATLGVFSKEFNDLKDGFDGDVCFLYVDLPEAGANSYCEFIIAGQSITLIALIVLMVLLLIGVFIRFNGFPVKVLILLIVSIITFLLSFIATIVLSAGFAKTCESVDDFYNGQAKCSSFTAYDTLQQSTALSWIETIFVGAVVAVASVYFVMRVRKRSSDNSK